MHTRRPVWLGGAMGRSEKTMGAVAGPGALRISEVVSGKRRYLPLLLLGDEQEDMIDRYLERGRLFVVDDGSERPESARAVAVVTDEGGGILEVKNIAVAPAFQHRGYGRALLAFVEQTFAGAFDVLQVGTGDSPLTVPFYEACGFERSHVVPNFFVDNYDHPIVEAGVRLVDMVYLRKRLRGRR